ncbi:MAG: PAS domain S-box protein [Gammaproteobacteria bacterium]|nr:PAS domain S-box protein [Gammaproteobacteria bacterium]
MNISSPLRLTIPVLLFLTFVIASLSDHFYHAPHYQAEVEEEGIHHARQLMNLLQSSINIMFRRNDIEGIRIQLSSLLASPDTISATIIDEQGIIILSKNKEDIGLSIFELETTLDKLLLHDAIALKKSITRLTDDKLSILSVYPVKLKPHESAVRASLAGFLVYEKSIAHEKKLEEIYSNQQLILHLALMTCFAFILWLVLSYLITRRVNKLLKLTDSISSGENPKHPALKGNDEFSLLEKSLLRMSNTISEKQHDLTTSENRLRTSQNFSHMGSWEWTISTDELNWSDNVASMLGLDEKSLAHTKEEFIRSIHSNDRDMVSQRLSECINNSAKYGVELRVITPAEDTLWIHMTGDVERDNTGTPVRMLGMVKDISALKESEQIIHETLRELDYQKNAIDKHSIVGITDNTGRIIYVNDNFAKLSGYSRDELIGKNHRIVNSGHHSKEFFIDLWNTISTGKTWQGEVCNKKKNGDLFWLNTTIIPHFNKQGQLDRYSAIRTDITDEVVARETIIEEQKLLKVINYIQSECLVRNKPSIVFNQLLQTILNITESEYGFIGEVLISNDNKPYLRTMAITDISWDEKSRAIFEEHHDSGMTFKNLNSLFGNAITTGQPVISNDPSNDPRSGGLPEGHPNLNSFLGVPLYAGEQLIGLASIANRKKGYDEVFLDKLKPLFTTCSQAVAVYRTEESRRKISEDLSRFKSTLDHSMDCIFIFDPETLYFLYVNEGAMQQVGYSHNELINLTPADICPDYDESRFRRLLSSLITDPQHSVTFETRIQHIDGSYIPVEIFLQYVEVANEVPRFVISSRDISEKQHLHKKLEQAQKMEVIGQLTGGIAHDFNNILTSIIGFTNLSLQRLVRDDQSELREYLNEVATAGNRARDIVSQLLTFSRTTDSDAIVIHVSQLIEESIKLLSATLPTSITLTTRIEPDIPSIKIAPVQLQQAIMNICINARDSIEDKGKIVIAASSVYIDRSKDRFYPHPTYCDTCLETIPSGNYLQISISDNGCGMNDETKKRIFEPFFTTKDVGKGTGMGLSMVHGVTHSNHGHIQVHTQVGSGTNIKLLFPATGDISDEIDNSDVTITQLTDYDLKGARILIIDDDKSVAKFIGGLLTSVNANVTTITDSVAAWDLFNQGPTAFDLIITDQTMPKLTGIELSTKIIALRPDLPIIIMSGYSEQINENTVSKKVFSAFLHKPIDNSSLINTVIESLSK